MKYKINKDAINTPDIIFTKEAQNQLRLIIDNDFTCKGKYFRILISGKNCDGPIYSTGMDNPLPDDMELVCHGFTIIMDSFSAFYLQKATVDYTQDYIGDKEGFVVINHRQNELSGKFWIDHPEKIPPGI